LDKVEHNPQEDLAQVVELDLAVLVVLALVEMVTEFLKMTHQVLVAVVAGMAVAQVMHNKKVLEQAVQVM
jgi:hypothetical protein